MTSHSVSSSNIQCHYCHNKGHIVARCPHHTLAIRIEGEEILHDSPIEDFNLVEPATSEAEYKENCEDL